MMADVVGADFFHCILRGVVHSLDSDSRQSATGAIFYIAFSEESSILWTQVAGKEKLGASIPTVFQGDILGNLLNAWRDNNHDDCVLHTTTQDSKI